MTPSLDEIKQTLLRHKNDLGSKYGITEIAVFGSYTDHTQSETSDVDIMVEFGEAPGLLKFIEIELYLEELIGKPVDLIRKKAIREELRTNIMKTSVVI